MIVTDYPDANLMENLAHNVAVYLEVEERRRADVKADSSKLALQIFDREGYIWGKPFHST